MLESDGTLIIYRSPLRGGTEQTMIHCVRRAKSYKLIDAERTPIELAVTESLRFIEEFDIQVLNVAGPRASQWAEGYEYAAAVLRGIIPSSGSGHRRA